MLSLLETRQYELCLEIAQTAHKGQFRRDGKTPYVEHPIKVSKMNGIDGTCFRMCAGLLHDVLEDTPWTEDDLRKAGVWSDIIDIVKVLTKREGMSYYEYLTNILDFDHGLDVDDATAVKIADIVSNLTDTPTPKQIAKYTKALMILACTEGNKIRYSYKSDNLRSIEKDLKKMYSYNKMS